MRLAFAGASGTGKSELTKYIAQRYGLPIVPIGSRSVARDMGFKSPYDVDAAGMRGVFQRKLLADKSRWELDHNVFVTDRTTLDNLAYASLHAIDHVTDSLYDLAIEAMARYDVVVYCPLSAFHHLGTDTDRRLVNAKAYHGVYDALLEELISRHAPRLITLYMSDVDARRKKLDELF